MPQGKRTRRQERASQAADAIFKQWAASRPAPMCAPPPPVIDDSVLGHIAESTSPYLEVGESARGHLTRKKKKYKTPLPTRKDINRLMKKGRKSYEHLHRLAREHRKNKAGGKK